MESTSKKRVRIRIEGTVQGVGFRPFIYQRANSHGLSGFVFNDGEGVIVELEGVSRAIENFFVGFEEALPPLAEIQRMLKENVPLQMSREFIIENSIESEIATTVPADISVCYECLREMEDPTNRRYRYPFINCTNCGPRYTIIKALPYDRKNTSMHEFTMCPSCQKEYTDPNDRRYHAEPISCYECGPTIKLIHLFDEEIFYKEASITQAVALLKAGKIIALKGLGGFHIVCDATNQNAVMQLRRAKHRPTKPLAVMFASLREVQRVAKLSKKDEELLCSRERPIVVVAKGKRNILADAIAPNIDRIGIFLPYTPLHKLILEALGRPMVATSANLSDEPIIIDEGEVVKKLSSVVDAVLTHNREIVAACDDSVVMSVAQSSVFLRLARGYAPKSFYLREKSPKNIIAVGANQKNTFAIVVNQQMILTPHIGDLNSLESVEYFQRTLQNFQDFYNFKPDVLICDKHPGYETTIWAKEYVSKKENVKLVSLQHHYCHALAVMAEYDLDEDVLAFCFDGTGYGDDGLLWGGEVLIASPQKYERCCHFQNIHLLGGEKAVREPRRVGLSLFFECFSLEEILLMRHPLLESFSQKEIEIYHQMFTRQINTPKSSSVGRLFDGIYALSGFTEDLGYEGESGLIMESLAKESQAKTSYSYTIAEDGTIIYTEMIYEILKERSSKLIAKRFLNTLADIVIDLAQRYPNLPVILGGGVFQNKLLVSELKKRFEEQNIRYYIQEQTPVNDGAIALGQAYWAVKNIR